MELQPFSGRNEKKPSLITAGTCSYVSASIFVKEKERHMFSCTSTNVCVAPWKALEGMVDEEHALSPLKARAGRTGSRLPEWQPLCITQASHLLAGVHSLTLGVPSRSGGAWG